MKHPPCSIEQVAALSALLLPPRDTLRILGFVGEPHRPALLARATGLAALSRLDRVATVSRILGPASRGIAPGRAMLLARFGRDLSSPCAPARWHGQ